MTDAKRYKVSLTRYPEEFVVLADNKDDALHQAREQAGFSVWDSEVEVLE